MFYTTAAPEAKHCGTGYVINTERQEGQVGYILEAYLSLAFQEARNYGSGKQKYVQDLERISEHVLASAVTVPQLFELWIPRKSVG